MSRNFGVAIVTGCGQRDGIGAEIARALAASGAKVVVTDRPLPAGIAGDGLDSLAAELNGAALRADVTNEDDCNRTIAITFERFGAVDILVNNAGADHGRDRLPIDQVLTADWQRVLTVNLTGAFLMCRAVVPTMVEQTYGRIINISSLAAIRGSANKAAYAASKAGLLGLTIAMSSELAAKGLTVNAICPGPIETSRARSTAARNFGAHNVADGLSKRASQIPVGRMGQAGDIARAVSYFAHPESGFVTGQILAVDGGIGARQA